MFEQDAIQRRGQALEDEFFHRVDQKLIQDLRNSTERDSARKALREATNFADETLLNQLLDKGFTASSITALMLLPSVFVAWADGSVSDSERTNVIQAALQRGVDSQSVAYQLIQSWLDKRPPHSLWEAWREYAEGVRQSMSSEQANTLAKEIVDQATRVAEASGGMLGIGKVSAAEKDVIERIRKSMS
jgi:uncharacterized membrane protein YebE (DUF533 family)